MLSRHWEAVAKYESLDPNTRIVDRYDIGWTTLGANWLIDGHREKVQLDYVFKRGRLSAASDNTLLVQYQRYLRSSFCRLISGCRMLCACKMPRRTSRSLYNGSRPPEEAAAAATL